MYRKLRLKEKTWQIKQLRKYISHWEMNYIAYMFKYVIQLTCRSQWDIYIIVPFSILDIWTYYHYPLYLVILSHFTSIVFHLQMAHYKHGNYRMILLTQTRLPMLTPNLHNYYIHWAHAFVYYVEFPLLQSSNKQAASWSPLAHNDMCSKHQLI